jgi:hypothetical protein
MMMALSACASRWSEGQTLCSPERQVSMPAIRAWTIAPMEIDQIPD